MDGIHILICRGPTRVQVTVWPESQLQTFTAADAERLRKFFIHRRYSSGFDQALLDSLDEVRDTLHRNLHMENPEEGAVSGRTMALLVAGAIGCWALLSLVGWRASGPSPLTPTTTASKAGLLGAMFGQVAAVWIYDRLFPAPPAGAVSRRRSPRRRRPDGRDGHAPGEPTRLGRLRCAARYRSQRPMSADCFFCRKLAALDTLPAEELVWRLPARRCAIGALAVLPRLLPPRRASPRHRIEQPG